VLLLKQDLVSNLEIWLIFVMNINIFLVSFLCILKVGYKLWSNVCQPHGYHNVVHTLDVKCRNLSLGLATKARACEGASQVWSLGVTFHVPGSVKKGKGMNSHTPKWASTLGVGVLMDSQIFIKWFQGSKSIVYKSYLYHWKVLGT